MKTCAPEEVGFSADRLQRINTKMQSYVDDGKLAGIVTLVARHGKIAHFEKFGMRDIAAEKPMELDTIVRVYSMTKPIVSVALMMLYEQGLFRLADPISKFIPEFKDPKVYVDDGKLVDAERPPTIRDFLRHTAGIGYGGYPEPMHPVDAMYDEQGIGLDYSSMTLGELSREIGKLPLLYHPGRKWHYSYAADVVGHLVEVIADMPIADFFEERIFSPLGMADTSFVIPQGKIDRFAKLYAQTDDEVLGKIENNEQITGRFDGATRLHSTGGGLISTAADYLRFSQLILNKGELDGVRVLGRKTVELMTMNHISPDLMPLGLEGDTMPGIGFGLGFSVLMNPAAAAVMGSVGTHGWGGMASTTFWIDPQEDMTAILMTQYIPGDDSHPVTDEFYTLVYQALVD
jgi:CubicO group peptidase (beta-lactamase class C family)